MNSHLLIYFLSSTILTVSFKILCSKHCALHEIISVKSHYKEISTIIYTIDEENEAYREVKEAATLVNSLEVGMAVTLLGV